MELTRHRFWTSELHGIAYTHSWKRWAWQIHSIGVYHGYDLWYVFFFVKLIITHFFCLVNFLYVSFSTFHQSPPKLRSSTNFWHLLGLHPTPKTTMTGWKSPPWMSRWSCDRFSGVDFNQIPSTCGRLASKIARFRGSLSARNAKCRVPGAPGAVSSRRGTCVSCYRSELDQQKKELLFSLFFCVTSINEMNWNESYLFDSWRKLKTLGFP